MRLLVLNCNTSLAMTEAIGAAAQAVASPGTTIVAARPAWGPDTVEGFYESYISAAAGLDYLTGLPGGIDAVILAGFGEYGREGARQLLTVPVVDITEAAVMTALLLGRKYGVVTTPAGAIGQIEDSLLTAGLDRRCAGVVAGDLPMVDQGLGPEPTAAAGAGLAQGLLQAGADVIVLGCAGFSDLVQPVAAKLGVPVIDGVAAAVTQAEGLVRLGQTTSKVGAYAPPAADKARPGWPVSAQMGEGASR
ncbi:MAG: aspartate/glutamate racemase family protein [Bifidobacteriaceae bacterium]|nr:aspartate/glutamate racemase family protein [Bifidobacteriaceae bacterium]